MWPNHNGEEPDWVKNERSQFHEHRDRNGDGKMDKAEVKEWIIPPDYDHSEAEARHLIYETDGDKVGWQKNLSIHTVISVVGRNGVHVG